MKDKMALMDYLYGEMDAKEKSAFERKLHESPQLQAELDQLKKTSGNLQQWEIPKSSLNMVFVTKNESVFERLKGWFRLPEIAFGKGFAVAAGAVAGLFLLLSAVNFRVSYSDQGFSMNMSLFGQKNNSVQNMIMIEDYVKNKQDETLQMVSKMFDSYDQQSTARFSGALNRTVQQINAQREVDLGLVSKSINSMHTQYHDKFLQNDRKLNNFIKLINSNVSNQPGNRR